MDNRAIDIRGLSPEQRRALLERLLREKSERSTPASRKECLHHLFEFQVKRTPEAVAVVFENEQLTYSQLNARANQLAHHLRSLGIGPEAFIAICMSRTPDLVVAILGALKAGGAYVPLDPEYPKQWLSLMLADARATVLLSQDRFKKQLPRQHAKLICLDTDWHAISRQSGENPPDLVSGGNVACAITSTGRGILLEHRGIRHRLDWLQNRFALSPSDVLLHNAPLSQETAVWQLVWPLAVGARVILTAEDEENAAGSLQRLISTQGITCLHLVPAKLWALVQSLDESGSTDLMSLRYLLSSGGPLPRELVERLWRHWSGEITNLYSLPEAAGVVAAQSCRNDSPQQILPLGRPANMSLFVLDKQMQLVPVGVTGELYVAGASLARGYLQAPGETAERFVENPFAETESGRLFSTGDRGRRLDDGTLELIGPANGQAWINGFRIELGDVAAALLDEPSVEDCAVLVRETQRSTLELVAYVVSSGPFSPDRLRSHMQTRLPAHMIPGAFVPISCLPLTASGRVDQQVLRKLEVIEADLVEQWEDQLRSISGIEQAAMVVQEQSHHVPPLHLSDLLPGWKNRVSLPVEELTSTPMYDDSGRQDLEARAMAFSDGGRLIVDEQAPRTLVEALIRTATRHKERGIVYMLAEGRESTQTYGSLLQEAGCIQAGLSKMGLSAGDRAILQIQSLRDHVPAFWGCVLGGITPVTVAVAPSYDGQNSVINKLYSTWKLLDQPPILASDALLEPLTGLKRFMPMDDLKVLAVDQLRDHSPSEPIHQSRPDDVVFFQLTSGSTGAPKCIQETHRGIIAHIRASQQFNGYTPEDVSLNWLPMDHVVPILTCHLKDVYLGCQQVAVSTDIVLSNPLRWLDLIEKYRVTHTWSPNFGYKLVADALAKTKEKTWDLSSIKFFMNAGEQVTLPVVGEFLELVAPLRVSPRAMQPAFGMAEVCTCMTYQNQFDCQSGVHRIEKSSLGDRLRHADGDDRESMAFIDLGAPMPGVQIRITDSDNQLLPEGVIGRLQIKGDVVTPGYVNNEMANREAFVGDGWFNSGDLGFIFDGRLTLTGREKELIIIHGANHYCYEIEDIVNQIEGVEPTYAAACGFDDPDTGTEGLAIFFTPRVAGIEENIELIKSIRARLASELGTSPAYVVPVAKQEFPKTTSGKIQRTRLKTQLAAGQFQDLVKEIDIRLQNANTIPGWFYQVVWRPRRAATQARQSLAGPYLLFVDQRGLGSYLCEQLERRGVFCLSVEAGPDFVALGPRGYRIDPTNPDHYRRLLETLAARQLAIGSILHCWNYDELPGKMLSRAAIERAQHRGLYSLLHLVQALTKSLDPESLIQMFVISSFVHQTHPTEEIAAEKTMIPGLLKTIPQELPWLRCRQIDLPIDRPEVNGRQVLQELRLRPIEREVAYRNGERLVPRLERVDFSRQPTPTLPFKTGGLYLLSGGLGGLGREVASYLLERYQARLLLIGRTSLPDRSAWPALRAKGGALARRIEAYESLEGLGGEISYQTVDVCDLTRLQQVVERAKARWGREIDGVFHLAGLFRERMLVEETEESFSALLRPKVIGAWALRQLLPDRPDVVFISFSSANGVFGGVRAGAYAAANSFLDGFSRHLRSHSSLQSYCFHWSLWDEIGMSRNYGLKQLARARGYHAIAATHGLYGLLAGLGHNLGPLVVGLDGNNHHIRRLTGSKPLVRQKLTAYVSTGGDELPGARLQRLTLRDRFRTEIDCDVLPIRQMPLTQRGEIDRAELARSAAAPISGSGARPRTEVERALARIWQEVLSLPRVSLEDNFFQLGGHSLLGVRLIYRIRDELQLEVPLEKVIEAPTISSMARWIEANRPRAEKATPSLPQCVLPIQAGGTKRPFFCVHPAGGSPLCYVHLASHLGQDQPFYGFQSPALLGDGDPLTRIEEIAASYVDAMRLVQPNGPFLIGGWSSGGPVAFEMARQLSQQDQEVALLALFDCGLPDRRRQRRMRNPLFFLLIPIMLLTFVFQMNGPTSYRQFRFLAQLVGISLPESLGGFLRPGLIPQMKFFRRFLAEIIRSARVFAANSKAVLTYTPAAYQGPATVFRFNGEGSAREDPVAESVRQFVSGQVTVHTVPGNHMLLLDRNQVGALAAQLKTCLDQAQQ